MSQSISITWRSVGGDQPRATRDIGVIMYQNSARLYEPPRERPF